MYTQNVIISMDQEDVRQSANDVKPARERPVWLRESTVQGAYDPDEMKEGKKTKGDREMLQFKSLLGLTSALFFCYVKPEL